MREQRRIRRSLRGAVVSTLVLAFVSACANSDDRQVVPPVVLGMTETTAPAYDDGETQIYQVGKEVRLPFRAPKSDAERPKGERDPYPRPAFHLAADSRVTVRFTLTNLEDQKHDVELLVDPWNEFVRYVPGFVNVRDEEVEPNFSGIQRSFVLEPKSRVEGIITPDDIVELATDLTIAMELEKRPPDAMSDFAGPALYNRTFEQQNRSSLPDVVLAPWMPVNRPTIAGIIGFDLGLRTAKPAKIAVELVIDVLDLNGDRVIIDGDEGKLINKPGTMLTPPAAPPKE